MRSPALAPHLAVGIGTAVVYSVGMAVDAWVVQLVIGAFLAFYLPGSVIVNMRHNRLLSGTSVIERTALSVVLSVAYIGLVALVLDQVAWGITQVTLLGAIVTLLMVGIGVEVFDRTRARAKSADAD